jgi:predicted TIM-barrel fold metal-dependent hydrolase
MIIDSHAHMDEVLSLGWFDPPERVIGFLDRAGIDMAVVSTYCNLPGINNDALEYVYEGVKKFPDRLIPYVRLDPWYGEKTLAIIDKAVKDYNFKGVKLHPVHYTLHPYGADTVNIMKRAAEYDIPVLFHSSDEAMCLPLQIAEGVRQSPETKVILAHMGGFYHVEDAIRVCKEFPNVYLDTCENPFPYQIRTAVEELGADRVLFGTDIPTDNPFFEIEKIKCLNLSKEEEDLIFYKNIARLLNLKIS